MSACNQPTVVQLFFLLTPQEALKAFQNIKGKTRSGKTKLKKPLPVEVEEFQQQLARRSRKTKRLTSDNMLR
jgi:hypothetical protein